LIVRNDASELSRVSAWVDAWAQHQGLPVTLVHHLDLCATELVTNVIDHAFEGAVTHPISLRLAMDHDRITLEVEDDGKPFDPRAVAPPPRTDLDERPPGGWGLAIVRHFADELRYLRTAGRNRLTVVLRVG
jgi:anti-sigma regulatory factor (Ser/Thr protein kinase)